MIERKSENTFIILGAKNYVGIGTSIIFFAKTILKNIGRTMPFRPRIMKIFRDNLKLNA